MLEYEFVLQSYITLTTSNAGYAKKLCFSHGMAWIENKACICRQ